MRPWLIGELNPYGTEPEMALYPLPEHASGGRLARILCLSRGTYLRAFRRMNLCVGKWSDPVARNNAGVVLLQAQSEGTPIILLGAKVCGAFFLPFQPFTQAAVGKVRIIRLPHPSGLSRAWNEPNARQKARELVLPLVDPSAFIEGKRSSQTIVDDLS